MSATAPDFIRRGLTYRQLDHWVTKQYLIPEGDQHPGNGRVRRFPHSELRVAALMIRLTDAGISVAVAARLARTLDTDGRAELAPGVLVEVSS